MTSSEKDPWAAFFDERAEKWEENCYPPEARERLQDLVPLFGVQPGTVVLDLGSGTGVLAPYLREILTETGTLVAMDVSFEMVRHAAKKPHYANGGVVQGTAFHLPFCDESMDTVVCFAAFPHFADKEGALKEMYRVLQPGGTVVVAHLMSREELSRHHGTHKAVAKDRLPDAAGMQALFEAAKFPAPLITDIPGRYVAKSVKETS